MATKLNIRLTNLWNRKPASERVYEWLSDRVCIEPARPYADVNNKIQLGVAYIDDGGPIPLAEFQEMLARGFNPSDPEDTSWLQ